MDERGHHFAHSREFFIPSNLLLQAASFGLIGEQNYLPGLIKDAVAMLIRLP